jgi:hypothetical protein
MADSGAYRQALRSRVAEAIAILEQVAGDMVRVLGPDHRLR